MQDNKVYVTLHGVKIPRLLFPCQVSVALQRVCYRVWGGGCGCGEVGVGLGRWVWMWVGGGGGGVVWGGRVYLFSCLLESMALPWVIGMVISRIHFTTRWYICHV